MTPRRWRRFSRSSPPPSAAAAPRPTLARSWRAALASRKQGKYWQFHLAMLGHQGKLAKEDVDRIAVTQGLDLASLKMEMQSPEIAHVIDRNQKLAQLMAINGTPAFIIDRKVIPGYLPKEGLAAAIKQVRDTGGCAAC